MQYLVKYNSCPTGLTPRWRTWSPSVWSPCHLTFKRSCDTSSLTGHKVLKMTFWNDWHLQLKVSKKGGTYWERSKDKFQFSGSFWGHYQVRPINDHQNDGTFMLLCLVEQPTNFKIGQIRQFPAVEHRSVSSCQGEACTFRTAHLTWLRSCRVRGRADMTHMFHGMKGERINRWK